MANPLAKTDNTLFWGRSILGIITLQAQFRGRAAEARKRDLNWACAAFTVGLRL
ncbi:MAG: hypothetical protein J0G28_16285 [Afipia sp.]|nr:hypothetical protein [Afipia sp.]